MFFFPTKDAATTSAAKRPSLYAEIVPASEGAPARLDINPDTREEILAVWALYNQLRPLLHVYPYIDKDAADRPWIQLQIDLDSPPDSPKTPKVED
jgi:hypothetical protein